MHPSQTARRSVIFGVEVEDAEVVLGRNPLAGGSLGSRRKLGGERGFPPHPCWVQEQRNPEHSPLRSHSFQLRRITGHRRQRCRQRVGSSTRGS